MTANYAPRLVLRVPRPATAQTGQAGVGCIFAVAVPTARHKLTLQTELPR